MSKSTKKTATKVEQPKEEKKTVGAILHCASDERKAEMGPEVVAECKTDVLECGMKCMALGGALYVQCPEIIGIMSIAARRETLVIDGDIFLVRAKDVAYPADQALMKSLTDACDRLQVRL